MPTDKWLISVVLYNIEQRKFKYKDSLTEAKIDPMIAVSIRWAQYSFFTIMAEMEKRFSLTAIAKGAVSFHAVKDMIDINAGYSSVGNTLCLGIAYNGKSFRIDVGINYHQQLNVSSGVALTICGDDIQKEAE